jgi:hypothetical protein
MYVSPTFQVINSSRLPTWISTLGFADILSGWNGLRLIEKASEVNITRTVMRSVMTYQHKGPAPVATTLIAPPHS